MVLTVRGTSQVPAYSGWLFSWVPLSFLGSLNVSLRSWLYLQYAQCSFLLLLEVWLLDMSSMSDLPQVFRTEMRLADVTVVQKLDCSVTYRGIPASFVPTHSFPEFSLFWGAFLSPTLFFPVFYSFTVDNKKTCVTDIFPNSTIIVTYDRFYLPKRLCDQQRCQGGHQHWLCALPLNQSGARWTRVHLSQMLICTAQLWGQRHSTCMWCKITWAGTPSPMLLGFSAHGPGIDVTHWGGQSVPLRLHHDAVPLAAVGSRCSEVTGTGL